RPGLRRTRERLHQLQHHLHDLEPAGRRRSGARQPTRRPRRGRPLRPSTPNTAEHGTARPSVPAHTVRVAPGLVRVSGVELPADAVIVQRLRARDEAMFAALLDAWSPGMLRVARAYVADEHAAQDVVQEAWLGVLRGIDGFEARASLRTWAYRILVNRAISRGSRDARVIPASSLTPTAEDFAPTV